MNDLDSLGLPRNPAVAVIAGAAAGSWPPVWRSIVAAELVVGMLKSGVDPNFLMMLTDSKSS